MPRSGTRNFNDPDDFQTNFRDGHLGLVFTDPGTFKARQTWVGLAHVHLVRTEEWLPRIAFVSLSRTRVFISFPMTSGSRPTWGGTELKYGDIVLHKLGAKMHQRTNGPNRCGYISLSREHLASFSSAVTGVELLAPSRTRILRPSKSAASDLLELCTKACDLAEKRSEILAQDEVSRAVDQEILVCLLKCLTTGREIGNSAASARHAAIMTKFEMVVTQVSRQSDPDASALSRDRGS